MKYIILDLEATCWQDKNQQHTSEIIEIGAVCVNQNKEIISQFSEFVKPILNPQLSNFCKDLTSIAQSQIDTAKTYDFVIQKFKEWININEEYVLCSWGFYDKSQFKADCSLHKLDIKWLTNHISLKHQYAEIKNLNKPIGMGGALKLEKLSLDGTHHRGIDDAKNIAKIFLKYFDYWKY
jgi:3'-5' exoribonuclease 1